jgi:polyisoprenoid-binding protein YceI
MEEHFNENYMDSDKFPKATFKGRLEGFDMSKLSKEITELNLRGVLNVRGKDKTIETIAKLSNVDGKILLVADFSVAPQDFDIDIPKIVRKKIAERINVNLNYELVQKN